MHVCVTTTSRADWNCTGMVVRALHADPFFRVSILTMAASQHAHDALVAAMRGDGVLQADMTQVHRGLNLTRDDPVNLGHAVAYAAEQASGVLWSLSPDLAIIPGDRWETVPVATVAALAGIPIAHIGGGDRTYGSYDDKWRNVITQLATIHFCTNQDSLARLVHNRLGKEASAWVQDVGSPAVDRILAMGTPPNDYAGPRPLIVVNWQPETGAKDLNAGFLAIIKALAGQEGKIIYIDQNDDRGSGEAAEMVINATCRNGYSFTPAQYLSILAHCDLLIGNSSSGIFEAPYFGTPVINVGNRQLGRVCPESVYWCAADADQISVAVKALLDRRPAVKPAGYYGDGHACERIVATLKEFAAKHGIIGENRGVAV